MDKRTGDTLNSDCECPAGKGPHGTCKHLAAVLLMLQHFTETGSIVIDKSCTENLQLFHKPKSTYHGKDNRQNSFGIYSIIFFFLDTIFYTYK